MIFTNIMNLPQPLVSFCQADEYKTADNEWRVTSLLKGTREAILERRHSVEVSRDVSDMIWLLFGTAVHGVLEAQEERETQFKEERIRVPVGDYLLSGKFDLFDTETHTVIDYKTASVWKIKFGDFSDWRRQTLIYCWMLRKCGFEADRAEVVAFLKDHNKREAKLKSDYPPMPVHKEQFEFTARDFAEVEDWLHNKFEEIREAEKLPDDQLPLCTMEQRFNSGDKYAVKKKGRKTALRVLDSREEAELYMMNNGGDAIEHRPGEDKKCIDYCSVCRFCDYWQELQMTEEDRLKEVSE